MKLESQVCSLDQGRQLFQLGISLGAFFQWWYTEIDTRDGKDHTVYLRTVLEDPTSKNTITFPAYSLAELMAMLPNEIDTGADNYFLTKEGQVRGYISVRYMSVRKPWLIEIQGTRTEADAMATLLIWALESGYTTAADCNSRLINS
jgi:hypothetical protein